VVVVVAAEVAVVAVVVAAEVAVAAVVAAEAEADWLGRESPLGRPCTADRQSALDLSARRRRWPQPTTSPCRLHFRSALW
jgi:hypothetical protein